MIRQKTGFMGDSFSIYYAIEQNEFTKFLGYSKGDDYFC